MREQREAEARKRKQCELASEVMPVCTDYNVSKVTPEGSKRCSNERSKRIAEASALALALEEEEIVLPEGSKRIAEVSALALALEEEEIVLPEEQKQAKLLRAKERIIDFKFNFHDYLRKKSCAIQRQPQQPFDNSTEESSLVSGLAAVHRFYEDRNMFRATCVCCSKLYAPDCVRTVPIEQGGTWLRRFQGRLSWDHTTFTCSANTVAYTKAQYSTPDSLLANLPLAPNGVTTLLALRLVQLPR